MQVLVILSRERQRIETHPDGATPSEGLEAWRGSYPPALPFQAVWAAVGMNAGTVAEIVTGYLPPLG